jgi:hypothetical protein
LKPAIDNCKWKFDDCPIVYNTTIGINPFAKRSNGSNGTFGSAYLCTYIWQYASPDV